jgi:formylglycine-generating enzyme required for sulfatase activity
MQALPRLPDWFAQVLSLTIPTTLLAGLLVVIAGQTGLPLRSSSADNRAPEMVQVPPGSLSYRPAGQYQQNGIPVDAPIVTVSEHPGIEVMKYQVTAADYARCVADGDCQKAEPRRRGNGNRPVTGVNFKDAEAYAGWLSDRTGGRWRLPTDEEWAYLAGSRLVDDALELDDDGSNPAERWLANYEREAARAGDASTVPQAPGTFGANEFGIADLGGNVWEWTASCDSRVTLDATGAVLSRVEACGVRILQGAHRTPMSSFIRDGRTGGCSVGAPPDNLGFRLVRETNWFDRLARRLP